MHQSIQLGEREYLEDQQPLGFHVYKHILKKVEHTSNTNSVLFKRFSVSHVKHILISHQPEFLK